MLNEFDEECPVNQVREAYEWSKKIRQKFKQNLYTSYSKDQNKSIAQNFSKSKTDTQRKRKEKIESTRQDQNNNVTGCSHVYVKGFREIRELCVCLLRLFLSVLVVAVVGF